MNALKNALGASRALNLDDQRFAELARSFTEFVAVDGVTVRPYDDHETPLFCEMTEVGRQAVLHQLGTLMTVCENVRRSGHSVRDPVAILWAFCKHSGYRAPSDLPSKISPEDVTDIYNDYHQLIFANLKFFEFSTNSLEELYCQPWQDLFSRSEVRTEEIARVCKSMISGEARSAVDMSYLGTHTMTEITGANRSFEVENRWIAPLSGANGSRGYICVNKARII